jgi:hypothetical protein
LFAVQVCPLAQVQFAGTSGPTRAPHTSPEVLPVVPVVPTVPTVPVVDGGGQTHEPELVSQLVTGAHSESLWQ